MSEAKHTPGPWHAAQTTVYALHGHPLRNRFSASVQGGRRDDAEWGELLANARLMAAAPELLEACRDALDAGNDGDWQSAEKVLRAAIAKAEGA
jgi:hypothetical protein